MGEMLEVGFEVGTVFNGSARVQRFLAEGGQGAVYVVDYNGEPKALKWYKQTGLGADPDAFYENIKDNIERGAPSPEFLWPQDITEWSGGSFGYIMDLRPAGYYEVTEFMLTHQRFGTYRAAIDAAMHIVSAFRILHNAGYCYQDINDGNFFINPSTGKVLICDNDNVAPEGVRTGIKGKPRYMAPEIVRGDAQPNSLTDRFSMSVILYILFCLDHPLEGCRFIEPAITPALQKKLYGTDPVFMMDPENDCNRPAPVVHTNTLSVWPCLPDYVQDIFTDAFSKRSLLLKPSSRPKEIDWLKVLTRFRSDIYSCGCGNEVFTRNGENAVCEQCGKQTNIPFRLNLGEYRIPAIRNSRVYRCQLGICDERDALSPVAQVVQKSDTLQLGLRNKSGRKWDAVTSKGTSKKVADGEVIPLKDGISFMAWDQEVAIEENT